MEVVGFADESDYGANNYLNSPPQANGDRWGYANHPIYDGPTADSHATILNALILHRQGPYGYPTWKQIRGAEHPVARYNRKKNVVQHIEYERIEYTDAQKTADNRNNSYYVSSHWDSVEEENYRSDRAMIARSIKSFVVPPVSNRYLPMKHSIVDNGGNNITLKHSYGNSLNYTPYAELNENLTTINPRAKKELIYDRLTGIIKKSKMGLTRLVYKENIYPKEKFT